MHDEIRNLQLNALHDYVNKQCAVLASKDTTEPKVIVARDPKYYKHSYQAIVIASQNNEHNRPVIMKGDKAKNPRGALMYLLVELEQHIFWATRERPKHGTPR